MAGIEITSTYRLSPANGNPIEVGVGKDGFIAYAVEMVNGEKKPCPDHPFVKEICAKINKPWFGL